MLVGSLLSSRVPDRYVRPVIAFVIFASGLKYVGVDTTTLGWILCVLLLAAATSWLLTSRPWQPTPDTSEPAPDGPGEPVPEAQIERCDHRTTGVPLRQGGAAGVGVRVPPADPFPRSRRRPAQRLATSTGACVGTVLPPAGSGVTIICVTPCRLPGHVDARAAGAVTANRALVGCGAWSPRLSHTS